MGDWPIEICLQRKFTNKWAYEKILEDQYAAAVAKLDELCEGMGNDDNIGNN